MADEFDSLIDSDEGAPAPRPVAKADEFDALIDQDEAQSTQALHQSLSVATTKNPDKQAQAVGIAKQAGVDSSFAEQNLDELSQAAKLKSINQSDLIKRHPKLAKWLEEPDNAGMAHDDLEPLKKIEDTVNDHTFLSDTWTDFYGGIHQMLSSAAQAPALAYDSMVQYGKYLPGPFKYIGQGMDVAARKGAIPERAPLDWRENPVSNYFQSKAEENQTDFQDLSAWSDSFKDGHFDPKVAGRILWQKSVRSAPNGLLAVASALAGHPEVGLGSIGVTSGASKATQIQKENPEIDANTATGNALLTGGLEAGTEYLPLHGMEKWIGGIAKTWGRGVGIETAKEVVLTLAKSGATEFSEEYVNSVASDIVDYSTGVSKTFDPYKTFVTTGLEAAGVGLVSGITPGAGSVVGAVHSHQKLNQAKQAKEFYTSLGDSAEATKLKDRMPEAQKNLIEQITQGTPVENVYIPVQAFETYFQSKDSSAVKMAGELGISKELDEAKETGADLKIPLSLWVNKMIPDGHYKALANDIKFSPESKSLNEHKEEEKRVQEDLKKADEEAKPSPETDQKKINDEQAAQFEIKLAEQFQAASPLLKQADAKKVAALAGENLKVRSEIRGQTPEQIHAAEGGLAIQSAQSPETLNLQAGESVFNQRARSAGQSATSYLAEDWAKLPQEEKLKTYMTDPVSGTLNARAFAMTKATAEKPMVGHISIPGIKHINDSVNHQAGDDLYKHFGQALMEVAPEVAKVGGDFVVRVKDQAELDQIISQAQALVSGGIQVGGKSVDAGAYQMTGSVGKDIPSASASHQNYKTELEARGLRAPRGQAPLGFRVTESGRPSSERPAVVPADIAKEFSQQTPEEQLKTMAIDPSSGFLTYEAWQKLPVKQNRASIDINKLNQFNQRFGRQIGDRVLTEFESVVKEVLSDRGLDIDMTHKSGDEYLAQSDNGDQLNQLLQEVESRLFEKTIIMYAADGQEVPISGITMSAGIGANDVIAEEELQKSKRTRELSGSRRLVNQGTERSKDRRQQNVGDRSGRHSGVNYRRNDSSASGGSSGKSQGPTKLNQSSQNGQSQSAILGQIEFSKKHGALMTLFTSHNFSTALHEMGHFFLNNMKSDVAYLMTQDPSKFSDVQQRFLEDSSTMLSWLGIETWDQLEVKHHEQLAEGFEKYLAEGKAPSARLQRAFNTFKVWMISIYKRARNIQVDISPEITEVFNRMLATEEEIGKAYQAQEIAPLPTGVGAYKMSDKEHAAYSKAFEEAREYASAKITAKLMKDYKRTKEKFYREEKAKLRTEVDATLSDTRIYRAIDILQKGELPDGTPIKLSKADLIQYWGASGFEKIKNREGKYLYSREGGLHPDVAATLLGFESGDDLLTQISNTPEKKDLIEARVENIMGQRYPDLLTDGALPQEAIDAVHDDKRSEILRMEMAHIEKHAQTVAADVKRRLIRRTPSDKIVKEQAKLILGSKTVREVSPHRYMLAERKAAKEAGIAYAKGELDLAFEWKQKELINHELYRAALEAREFIDKQLKKFKKLARSDEDVAKTRDVDMVNAARAILAQFGLDKKDKPAISYLESMKKYDPERFENMMGLIDSANENVGYYKDIPLNDFVAMSDSVTAIYELSKSMHEIESGGIKHDVNEVREKLEAKIKVLVEPGVRAGYDKAVTKWQKAKMTLLGAKAGLVRIEHWAQSMDVSERGPFREFIWNPVSEATTKYRIEKEKVINQYRAILKDYAPRLTRSVIRSPELGYTFRDKAELMMAVLHSGNESNMDKLLRGRQWGIVDSEGKVDRSRFDQFISRMQKEGVLNKQDYDFAQKVWDLIDSMKPEAQKAHKRMYGYYFSEITANEVVTPFGVYKGGYVPAKVDVYTTEDAAIREERDLFEKNNNSFQFPTTGRGFTKSRTQQYAAPLSLELSMLGGHIDGVMRFTHIEPRVKEVMRLVSNKSFANQLALLDPAIRKDAIIPWLQRAATQKVVLPAQSGVGRLLDAGASFLRKNVAMQIMFGGVTNTLQQFTGLVVAMSKVKPRHIRNALVTYISDVKGTTEAIMERSSFMKSNQGSSIYEAQQAIEQITTNPGVFERMQDFSKAHTYFLQAGAQNIVNSIVWQGAYNQAIEQGLDEEQAVSDADSSVRLTQGTNNPEDISRFEVGTATERLFTQFTGYFNMLANLNAGEIQKISREVGLKKGAGKLFYLYMTAFMIPAVLSEAIVMAMSGRDPDEDDDGYLDDMLSAFFGSQFRTLTAMVPYVGTTINAATNRFNKKQYDDRLNLSPVVSTIETLTGVPAELYSAINGEGANEKRVVKDVLMLMGVMSSLPIGPIGKPAGYLMDVESGKANPTGPIDYTRGLITGRSGQ